MRGGMRFGGFSCLDLRKYFSDWATVALKINSMIGLTRSVLKRSLVVLIVSGVAPMAIRALHADGGQFLYVTCPDSNQVAIVDVTQNPVDITYVSVSGSPYGIASDPDGRYLYVACRSDNSLKKLDTQDGLATQTTIPLINDDPSIKPIKVLISADGAYAYVLKTSNEITDGCAFNVVDLNDTGTQASTALIAGTAFGMTANGYDVYFISSSTIGYFLTINPSPLSISSTTFPGAASLAIGINTSTTPDILFFLFPGSPLGGVAYYDLPVPSMTGGFRNFSAEQNGIPTDVVLNAAQTTGYTSISVNDPAPVTSATPLDTLYNTIVELGFDGAVTEVITFPNTLPLSSSPTTLTLAPDETALYVTSYTGSEVMKVPLPLGSAAVTDFTISAPFQGVFANETVFTRPGSPENARGVQKKNRFLFESELFNRITWSPSPSTGVIEYVIKKEGNVVQTISALAALEYEEHNLPPGQTYIYTITAINNQGRESIPTTVIVEPRP